MGAGRGTVNRNLPPREEVKKPASKIPSKLQPASRGGIAGSSRLGPQRTTGQVQAPKQPSGGNREPQPAKVPASFKVENADEALIAQILEEDENNRMAEMMQKNEYTPVPEESHQRQAEDAQFNNSNYHENNVPPTENQEEEQLIPD